MSTGFSFWNGQPVTSPVYPQMGDLLNPNASGYSGGHWSASSVATASASAGRSSAGMQQQQQQQQSFPVGPNQMRMSGMGDFRPLSMDPMGEGFFGPGQGQYEPCIENVEAYCAYNDINMQGNGAKGDFW
ncbi:hypothetical protein KR009_000368 [Drosophila setifemur]|nr:hypothetical protein KR009_000368 [Drosophila setifemur]